MWNVSFDLCLEVTYRGKFLSDQFLIDFIREFPMPNFPSL